MDKDLTEYINELDKCCWIWVVVLFALVDKDLLKDGFNLDGCATPSETNKLNKGD